MSLFAVVFRCLDLTLGSLWEFDRVRICIAFVVSILLVQIKRHIWRLDVEEKVLGY